MTGHQLYEFLRFFEPEKWNLFKTEATVSFSKETTKLALPEAFTTNNTETTNDRAIEQSSTGNHKTGHVLQYRETMQIIKTVAEDMHAKRMTNLNIIKFTENITRSEQVLKTSHQANAPIPRTFCCGCNSKGKNVKSHKHNCGSKDRN
ncbi:unnamed protein product [Orchesella dallaii]|uniref:Uncharacterized protein n=1 Tax=Orchesella dallaii TaxID=48710 RepID=A0ABP1RGX6_9HEXA